MDKRWIGEYLFLMGLGICGILAGIGLARESDSIDEEALQKCYIEVGAEYCICPELLQALAESDEDVDSENSIESTAVYLAALFAEDEDPYSVLCTYYGVDVAGKNTRVWDILEKTAQLEEQHGKLTYY